MAVREGAVLPSCRKQEQRRGNGVQRQGVRKGNHGLKQPGEMRVKEILKGLGMCWDIREALAPVCVRCSYAHAHRESCTPAGSATFQVGPHQFSACLLVKMGDLVLPTCNWIYNLAKTPKKKKNALNNTKHVITKC